MNYITIIGIGIALILTSAGAFFAYKYTMLWRRINVTGLSIEVTKDGSFLFDIFIP